MPVHYMTQKRKYLAALMLQPRSWIEASMSHPSPYMTTMHINLHALALRYKKI